MFAGSAPRIVEMKKYCNEWNLLMNFELEEADTYFDPEQSWSQFEWFWEAKKLCQWNRL